MKTPQEYIEQWKRDGDGEFEREELLSYLEKFILSIQQDAYDCGRADGLAASKFYSSKPTDCVATDQCKVTTQ